MEYRDKVPSTNILLATFGKLNICIQKNVISRKLCNVNENENFFKTPFFSITLTFIDEYTLNIDDIKEFLSFGLCWPFWPLWPWMIFLKQKLAFMIKIKHN